MTLYSFTDHPDHKERLGEWGSEENQQRSLSRGYPMSTTPLIVTTQQALDAALAEGVKRIIIDSPAGIWINVRGRVEQVTNSSVVRVGNGGSVEWVGNGGSVVRVGNGGRVVRVDNGGRVVRVDNGGRVEWVDNGGSVERVGNGGRVVRVGNGGRVVRAIKASSIHLHGGNLAYAAPTVAVFVHAADSTWSGGTLIDLRDLDLTDVEQWRVWVDARVDPALDELVITDVSSQGDVGELTKDGTITIGCFDGTVSDLRDLIAGDNWPSHADAESRARYRPRILAFAGLCEQQLAAWAEAAK